MGCGASAPLEVATPPKETAADNAPAAAAAAAPSSGGPAFVRSTKGDSKGSSERDRNARLALAKSVKKQVGFVPLIYIKSQFDVYDVDRNGALEVDELVNMMRDLQEDVDGGGGSGGLGSGGTIIDFHVFCRWYIDVHMKSKVKTLFHAYDADGNGTIEISEIPALLQDLSEDSDEDACAKAMSDMDGNEDGRVTLEEFETFFLGPWAKGQLANTFELYSIDIAADVDKAQLKATLDRMGAPADDAAVSFMFDYIDVGKTGTLKFEQFIDYATYAHMR
mmetsp:Transcript_21298/g.52894  ORF Transcript_21298/g.52894 Transcript_21298/m.52894 type:complete len:278 (+) Transcript_21298:265-1098(+)|eukprot:CAMPEP_0197591754 /NCGR_PEP_ID=MMETSP1326-20131121/13896_1 /TAXON_ID=1155430 /ORGANISM="Genus nov. species nov., Strain RCC2288" /LENGTH=277 /DNA_ID=CAMNT_0043157309 /DNA_START=253 /DNA_END=1086 /DNA_ORIENTATION=+